MPRSRGGAGGRSAPSRPTAAPASRSNNTPPQQRPMSTAAQPKQQQQQQQAPPQQASGGSGLFGQMASTAAGVAVGSSIGHAIGGFFGGGSSAAPAEPQQAQAQSYDGFQQDGQQSNYNSQYGAGNCADQTKNFTQCLDQNQGNMQICGWYLEQLKACQAAASQY